VAERVTTESESADDIFGEYPFLLYKHFYITRGNIAKFCRMVTGINNGANLSPEQKNTIEYLELLITHRLHLVTVSLTLRLTLCVFRN